jgi:hypothetical protein
MSWEAVVSFCEHVMLQKEAAEWRREEDPLAEAANGSQGETRGSMA